LRIKRPIPNKNEIKAVIMTKVSTLAGFVEMPRIREVIILIRVIPPIKISVTANIFMIFLVKVINPWPSLRD